MTEHAGDGRIVTFYSFKGGVGRTMALANVAFLAALNGQRVLVMDWDLEAPGLAYYFRGLLDPSDARALRETPGVLDFLWDWSISVKRCTTDAELTALRSRFAEGTTFEACVRLMLGAPHLPPGAALDFIGAGRRIIETPESMPYEEALARFSWSAFFDNEAGGFVLDSLRQWARHHYDLVLIDSRTGLADVAGICTMQIPDEVAMCFILNRQNIDGVAKVAAAIRAKRADEILLRAIPMRVARNDTPEESDATARAITEFTRIGGFSQEAVQEDFRTLPVAAADNVPFYETLAPFSAADPQLDPLTLNYLRLANQFVAKQLEVPAFDPKLMELARRRLAPRNATVEYLTKLRLAEPARAVAELQRLLDSALDTEVDGGRLDDDYITALVDVVFGMNDVVDNYEDAIDLQSRSLDLLRALHNEKSDKWRLTLIAAIERYLDAFSGILDIDEEQALQEEFDALLVLAPTIGNQLKRISYRRRAARRYIVREDVEAARQTVGEFLTIANDLARDGSKLASDQLDEILAAGVDARIVSGDAYRQRGEPDRALSEYDAGLANLAHLELSTARNELARLRHDLHVRLARALSKDGEEMAAARHALDALRWARGSVQMSVNFVDLATVVLRVASQAPQLVLEFCETLFQAPDGRRAHLAAYHGRLARQTTQSLAAIVGLTEAVAPLSNMRATTVVQQLATLADMVLQTLLRRRKTISEKHSEELSVPIAALIPVLEQAGLPLANFPALEQAYVAFRPRRSRTPPNA